LFFFFLSDPLRNVGIVDGHVEPQSPCFNMLCILRCQSTMAILV